MNNIEISKYENGAFVKIDKVMVGTPIDEVIDGTLDSATLICDASETNLLKEFQPVKITYGSKEKYFIVNFCQDDIRHTVTALTHKYTISLIEPTKYLEKVICQEMSFTNRTNKLIQQLERLLINAEPIKLGQQPRFRISESLRTFLGDTPGEDLFFQVKPTLREAIDGILAIKNSRCEVVKILDYNDIEIDYFNYSNKGHLIDIDLTRITNKKKIKNIEYLASDLESFAENSFTGNKEAIYHPSPNGFTTFKTDNSVLTTNNAKIETAFPIEEIKEFLIPITYRLRSQNISSKDPYDLATFPKTYPSYANTIINISSNIVDYDTYQLLPDGASAFTYDLLKGNTIYFTRENKDLNLVKYKGLFFSYTNLEQAIKNCIFKQGFLEKHLEEEGTPIEKQYYTKLYEILLFDFNVLQTIFRIKYIPYVNALVRVSKPNYQDIPSVMITNQLDKKIDLYRYGSNLKAHITRLGNSEISMDHFAKSFDELFELQDYTQDGYVVTRRTVSLFNNYIKANYVLSKNYYSANPKITIDRTKRIYNIPIETFVRNILITKKIKMSTELIICDNKLIEQITATFGNNSQKPITNVLVKTCFGSELGWLSTQKHNSTLFFSSGNDFPSMSYLPDANIYEPGTVAVVYNTEGLHFFYEVVETSDPKYSDLFELPINSYTVAESVYFNFQFKDNFSAGTSSEGKILGGIKQVHNRYVNGKGEYYNINIRLFNDEGAERSTNYNSVKEFPKTNEFYYNNAYFHTNETYEIIKDTYETHSITIRVALIGNDHIFVGDSFAKKLGLITKGNHNFKVYYSYTEKYDYLSTKAIGTIFNSTNSITPSGNRIIVDIPSNVMSWGIADSNGELIVGVNSSIPYLYFYEE